MFAALMGLMGSSGFGALVGWFGGLANRFVDLKGKKLDLEGKKLDHQHELAMRDKDMEAMRLESERAVSVASIEGAASVEQAAYSALTQSYAADRASYGIIWVDAIRGVVRPLLTAVLAGAALYVNYVALDLLAEAWPSLATEQKLRFALLSVEWVLFQGSVCIGWWFANRPSSTPWALKK
jgi:hypothetical protein